MQDRRTITEESKDKFVPLKYFVIIKPDPVSGTTSGGILIPETAQHREEKARERGTLMAIGPTAFPSNLWGDIKPVKGDRVLFTKYAGSSFIQETEEGRITFRLCSDEDIIAIIRKEE